MIFKQYIKMDEQALLNAGKNYDIDRMYEVFDELFTKAGFTKNEAVTDGIEYLGAEDLPKVSGLKWHLKKQEWFLPYCLKWIWSDKDDDETEWDNNDVLQHLRDRGEL
jgi:uncharacterized membrane-anchored protein